MIIPYNTDAPLHHFPWCTLGLIALNTVVFVATGYGIDSERIDPWGLHYGDGLHPVQWFTSNFLHKGFIHLAGNMLFLWGFGLIVEGKLGAQLFLAVYLGIGVLECALEQIFSLAMSTPHVEVGASAVVYGLMAMALVWAPRNELRCLTPVYANHKFVRFDIPIWKFSILFVAIEELTIWVTQFTFTTSLLHLLGAALGCALAVVMLKQKWVDGEGWDLFSILPPLPGKNFSPEELLEKVRSLFQPQVPQKTGKRKKRERDEGEAATATAVGAAEGNSGEHETLLPTKSLRKMKEALAEGKGGAAYAAYVRVLHLTPDWQLPEPDLLALIEALLAENDWGTSVRMMEEYIARFPVEADQIRLRLVKILLTEQRRPNRSMRILAEIPPGRLSPSMEQVRAKLEAEAQQMLDEGVLELDGEAWL